MTGNGPERAPGRGAVVLFTGLSGAGKSTIAAHLGERLHQVDPRLVTLLDGDEVRSVLSPDLGYSRADRALNVRRIGWVAALVAKHGGIAICASIAPYADLRAEVRAMAEAVGAFLLVHVSTPLQVCEQRDRKGLYARARRGEVRNLTGIDDPYEVPTDADIVIDTSSGSEADAVDELLGALAEMCAPREHVPRLSGPPPSTADVRAAGSGSRPERRALPRG